MHTHTFLHKPLHMCKQRHQNTKGEGYLVNLHTPHTTIAIAATHTHMHTPNKGPFCGECLMTSTPCSILGDDYFWCIIIVISTVSYY